MDIAANKFYGIANSIGKGSEKVEVITLLKFVLVLKKLNNSILELTKRLSILKLKYIKMQNRIYFDFLDIIL